jgi:ATP synthase F subunit
LPFFLFTRQFCFNTLLRSTPLSPHLSPPSLLNNALSPSIPETSPAKIIDTFKNFTTRPDISLILISQPVAEMIRATLDQYNDPIPAVLEIPSKDTPYNPAIDPLMLRINKMLGQME